jgi:hypothetical protein
MPPLACWDCGFESRPGHGCLSVVNVVYVVRYGLCVGLITRSEESCRVWCVWVWLWSLDSESVLAYYGLSGKGEEKFTMFLRSSLVNVQLKVLFLKGIRREQDMMAWTGLSNSGRGQAAGPCECGNETYCHDWGNVGFGRRTLRGGVRYRMQLTVVPCGVNSFF